METSVGEISNILFFTIMSIIVFYVDFMLVFFRRNPLTFEKINIKELDIIYFFFINFFTIMFSFLISFCILVLIKDYGWNLLKYGSFIVLGILIKIGLWKIMQRK